VANYYTHFVTGVSVTPEEAKWFEDKLKDAKEYADALSEFGETGSRKVAELAEKLPKDFVEIMIESDNLGFSWDGDGSEIYFMDDDGHGNVDHLATFLQWFLVDHPDRKALGFDWSQTCSKQREDGFSGGAIVVTATSMHGMDTKTWVMHELDKLNT